MGKEGLFSLDVRYNKEDRGEWFMESVRHQIPCVVIRKGYGICAMLTNLFLSHKRNVRGKLYSFIRFHNVCDASKLVQG